MKLTKVQFANNVSFGGMLQSASTEPVGDRPGEGAMSIDYDEKLALVSLTKKVNGVLKTKLVPLSNVVAFEIADEPKPVVKK